MNLLGGFGGFGCGNRRRDARCGSEKWRWLAELEKKFSSSLPLLRFCERVGGERPSHGRASTGKPGLAG